jgi:hypothetical protein
MFVIIEKPPLASGEGKRELASGPRVPPIGYTLRVTPPSTRMIAPVV